MEKHKNTLTFENTKLLLMKRVKAHGNGAYIGVPKEFIGKCLYVLVPNEKEKDLK